MAHSAYEQSAAADSTKPSSCCTRQGTCPARLLTWFMIDRPNWIDDPRATATGTVTRTGTRTRSPSPFLASNLCKANLMRRTAPSRFVCVADVARQKFHEYLISDSIVDRLGQHPFRAIGNMILRQFRDIIKLHFVCFVCLCLLAKFIVLNLTRKKPHSGCMNK